MAGGGPAPSQVIQACCDGNSATIAPIFEAAALNKLMPACLDIQGGVEVSRVGGLLGVELGPHSSELSHRLCDGRLLHVVLERVMLTPVLCNAILQPEAKVASCAAGVAQAQCKAVVRPIARAARTLPFPQHR